MQGRLWLVPTPLDFGVTPGDLQAVLPLAVLQTASTLNHWVVENAKTARAFLKRVDAVQPLGLPIQQISIVELPRPRKGSPVTAATDDLSPLLAPALAGHDIGLMSEAGLPAVADPGAALVQAAHTLGVTVHPLSGPSSLMLALAASGLNGQSFSFVGYLPTTPGERDARVRELETQSRRAQQTQLIIETPYRNEALRSALLAALAPTTWLSISSGLTLPGGWTRTAPVAHWRRSGVTLAADVPAVFAFIAR